MIFPIIFIYFTFFITINAEKTHEEVAKKFDEFIGIFFDKNPSTPTGTHHQWELTDILRVAEHHVAKPVLEVQDGQQSAIEQIYDKFQKFLDGNVGKKSTQFKHFFENFSHKQGKQEKVQFLMLLLSFATRVAFTIGSEALGRKDRHLGTAGHSNAHPPSLSSIQMDLFVLAYDKLEKAFPIGNEDENVKYRYYQGANLYPIDKENKVRFDFLKTHLSNEDLRMQQMRKRKSILLDNLNIILDNFTKLRLLFQQKHRISRLINVLKQIDNYYVNFENLGDVETFFSNFLQYWDDEKNYPMMEYLNVKIFSLKRFGVNLANHIRRQPEAEAYFQKYKEAKMRLDELLANWTKAVKKLEKKIKVHENEMLIFMNEQEMNMHYENAIKLDWRTKQEIDKDMIAMFDKWKNILSHCTNKAECKVDEVKKGYDANKAMFESLMIGNDFSRTLDHIVGSKTPENLVSLKKALVELTVKVENAINEEFQFKKAPFYKRAYKKVKHPLHNHLATTIPIDKGNGGFDFDDDFDMW